VTARTVRVQGEGRVLLPAYGIADAEHRVEKEITRSLPAARVSVDSVRRPTDAARIVEEFEVVYRVRLILQVEAADDDAAGPAAFRSARAALAGTRFERTSWSLDR
jgi:hypothetical protein